MLTSFYLNTKINVAKIKIMIKYNKFKPHIVTSVSFVVIDHHNIYSTYL